MVFLRASHGTFRTVVLAGKVLLNQGGRGREKEKGSYEEDKKEEWRESEEIVKKKRGITNRSRKGESRREEKMYVYLL